MAVEAGSWVQVEWTVLEVDKRAPNIPEDTKRTAIKLRTKGFLREAADVGDEATIETIIGRTLVGRLIAVNPPYEHGFGAPVPELLHVAAEMRELVGGAA